MPNLPRGGLLPWLSLTRTVTVRMVFTALILLGVIAWRGIPLELIPSGFTPPFLFVQVPTLASSPADMEVRLGRPGEEELATVRNLARMATRISTDSTSFLLEFADGTDMDLAYNQVRDRMERVLAPIEERAGRYVIWKYNPADDPVVWFGVSARGEERPGPTLRDTLVPRLERVAGVSRVEAFGLAEPTAVIELDARLVEAAGMTVPDLIRRLGADNFALASGQVEDAGRLFPVRTLARWSSVADLTDLPIAAGVRLGDVADLRIEDRSDEATFRVDGTESVIFAVYRESNANAVDVSRSIRQLLERDFADDPYLRHFRFPIFFTQGDVIEQALGNLQETLLWGGFFAILVLGAFLRRVGLTVLVAVAIPLSLLLTIGVLHAAGRSLNVLSLTGLMLAVGLVVDNAIVVVESIQRRRIEGEDPFTAALNGTAEIALAIVVATLTTVVVFLPLMLMAGSETLSFYLAQIGFPVCVGLLSSLLVSLLALPLACRAVLGDEPPPRVRTIEWLERTYAGTLDRALHRRTDLLLIAFVAFASIAWPLPRVIQTDRAEANINDFRIHFRFDTAVTWEERLAELDTLEAALLERRDTLEIASVMTRMGGLWSRPQIRVFLTDPRERRRDREDILADVEALLPESPGVTASLQWEDVAGPGGATTVQIDGPDSERLIELGEEMGRRLRQIPGISSVQVEAGDAGREELHLHVVRERALQLGLNPLVIGTSVDYALRGRPLLPLRTEAQELPVLVEGRESRATDLADLLSLELPGAGLPLGTVTTPERARGYRTINRENRRTSLSLTLFTDREDLDELADEIRAVADAFQWPRGYGLRLGDRFRALEEGSEDRRFALVLAILFVFLLMGVLFESVLLPFCILFSIPFAFVGVYWMLWITGTPFDTMAGVGMVLLVGIVVNNAIVLIDRVEVLRARGHARHRALVLAGQQRLRPILMTAMTTIFALIPMALGTSALVGIPYAPMGRAVIGGLLASTLLTLFVVPLFYTLLDDLPQWLWGARPGSADRDRKG